MESLVSLQNTRMMHFQYIFNLMQRFQGFLKFYDIRNHESFNRNHLKMALQVFPDIVSVDIQNINSLIHERDVSRLRRYCIVIGYSPAYEITAKQLQSVLSQLKCKEIHMLEHVEEFMTRYPFMCSSFKKLKVNDFPNEIIPNFLYLGSMEHSHNAGIVEALKITHILNCTKNSSNAFQGINYRRVFVEDSESEKISLFFEKAFEFIEAALDENMKGASNVVLVHCAQGVSRSATIVIMFLMRSTGLSVDDAKEFVKNQRDIIEPNEGFLKELRDFDRRQKQFFRRATEFRGNKMDKIEKTLISTEADEKMFNRKAVRANTISNTKGIAEEEKD